MRLPDWPQRLDECIEEARSREFSYGTFDCALFAAECVAAMTGNNYAIELRGYDNKVAAYRIVAAYGSLETMTTALLKREPIHPAMARRGDVVIGEDDAGQDCIGVCLGTTCAFPAPQGLRIVQRSRARLAWRIE